MKEYFELELLKALEFYKENNSIYEAMEYSLQSGGKRIRPMLILLVAKSLCKDYEHVVDIAIALEFIHSYSLVHDDLPAMDNDMYRRGKLTTHAKFGEYMGILAGDALLTESFSIVARSNKLKHKDKIIALLSKYAGIRGMICGQVLDMYYEDKKIDLETINLIHRTKTGALIKACFDTVLTEYEITGELYDKYISFGEKLGVIYQIQDDIFDSDDKEDHSNYVNIVGIDEAKKVLNQNISELRRLLPKDDELMKYVEKIFIREK